MHLSTLIVSTLSVLSSGAKAHPVVGGSTDLESRQSASLPIIQSAGYDLDVAVEASEHINGVISGIVRRAEKHLQTGVEAVFAIKPALAELKEVFTTTAWAVEGDLKDNGPERMSYDDKSMVIVQVDKIKAIARKTITTLTEVASLKSQEAEVLALSESKALQPYILAMLESISAFVDQSKDDPDSPGFTEQTQNYIKDAEETIRWPGIPEPLLR